MTAGYDPPMSKSLRFAGLLFALSLFAPLALAQDSTTIPAGNAHQTDKSGVVSGVRIEVQPDGSVWFLIPALDRIAVLRGDQITQWAIRDDNHLGANPVDFELDGDFVWFLCNGESGIDAGHSIFGQLDTTNGQVREWEVPGSRPAGFYRAADGKVWIPQTDRRLQSVDLTSLEVVDYRSGSSDGLGTQTIAYSDIVAGPDGALWMTDFGNNRIVRFEPGASTETSWTLFDPTLAILSPSQIQFDAQGRIWISEFTGGRIDRFDPTTGDLVAYLGFLNPIHFDLFGGRVYVTEANGGNGQIALLDPAFATASSGTIEPETLEVHPLVNTRQAIVREYTIAPTTFASPAEEIPIADLKVAAGAPGILRTEVPWQNAYGIDVVRGEVWVGSAGRLAQVQLQTIGAASDLVAPVASQLPGTATTEVRVDIMLHNSSDTAISGEALYLFSPGFFPARQTFTLAPGATSLVADAFGDLGFASATFSGPLRFHVTSGPAEALVASVRTAQAREDGGSFGYATPAFSSGESLAAGATRTLFTGWKETETSIFGFFTPPGAEAIFTLVAPDGTVRATLPISLTANLNQEFQPAAAAFGVSEEPGDVIRVSVLSGTILPYVRIIDEGTTDTALSLPAKAVGDALFPNAGTAMGLFGASFVSDLFLSSSDPALPASVTLSYHPLDQSQAPSSRTVSLAAGTSTVIENVLPTLFGVEIGQGALLVESDVPIASSLRIASRKEEGDFATLALPIDEGGNVPGGGSAFAIGAPQTATRRTNLLLYNRGAAGIATVIVSNGNDDEIGRVALTVGSMVTTRVNSVTAVLVGQEERNARLVVEASAGMDLYAWVAEVDGPTGDVEIQALRQ
jgi:streptogramin lyase